MFILNLWGEIRELFLRLDMIAFSFIDNVYKLFTAIAGESLISDTVIKQVLNNIYVLVGIFAFFRIALLLVNSIINPSALTKEGAGISKIFVNTIIMLVLLVFTPTLFQISRDLASTIVENNYIQKLFINTNDAENLEPGKEMQRIAIGAVITPEEQFVEDDGITPNSECDSDCKEALQCLNEINGYSSEMTSGCLTDEGVQWGKLVEYNGVKKGSLGNGVYIYNYRPLLLTVIGWTITYILLSFTFDVAKRMFELAILEIVSPLFIATIVDPKSMQSGPFKKWLNTFKNSYISLFIRIAAVSLIILCVKILSIWRLNLNKNTDVGSVGILIILIALLIFIKQLPKWFSNMIGIDGDGLGNLGIGKKIGSAAVIGGLATKAGHALVGAGIGAARGTYALRKANKAKQQRDRNNAFGRAVDAAREEKRLGNGRTQQAKAYLGSYFKPREAGKNIKNWGSTFAAGAKGIFSGSIDGAKTGFGSADIKDVKAQLKARQKDMLKGAGYTSSFQKIGKKIENFGVKTAESVIGTKSAQEILKKNMANKDLAENMLGTKLYMNNDGDLFYDDSMSKPVAFDPKTIRKKWGSTVNGIEDVLASMVSGTENSHFITKDLSGQTYLDSSGNLVTTGPITKGTLVRDMKDPSGQVITDINGNIVKEAVINPNTSSAYKVTDVDINDAIDRYKEAVKDKTGQTGYDFTINGETLHLTGQGVLEYEAAFASIKDENANTWVSVNERKANIIQQLAELQSNFADAQNNLRFTLMNTEYAKAESRRSELEAQKENSSNLIDEFNNKMATINREISNANNNILTARSSEDIEKLTNFIKGKERQREAIETEISKYKANIAALNKSIAECNNITSNINIVNEYERIKNENENKLSAITDRITSLQKDSIDITKELGVSISYGSDITTKVAGVEENLNASNSERFLAETGRQKSKTRETADNYKNDNKQDTK